MARMRLADRAGNDEDTERAWSTGSSARRAVVWIAKRTAIKRQATATETTMQQCRRPRQQRDPCCEHQPGRRLTALIRTASRASSSGMHRLHAHAGHRAGANEQAAPDRPHGQAGRQAWMAARPAASLRRAPTGMPLRAAPCHLRGAPCCMLNAGHAAPACRSIPPGRADSDPLPALHHNACVANLPK